MPEEVFLAAQEQWCLFPSAREMRKTSGDLRAFLLRQLAELLGREEPMREIPAMAFLVEVSVLAGGAPGVPLTPLVSCAPAAGWTAVSGAGKWVHCDYYPGLGPSVAG